MARNHGLTTGTGSAYRKGKTMTLTMTIHVAACDGGTNPSTNSRMYTYDTSGFRYKTNVPRTFRKRSDESTRFIYVFRSVYIACYTRYWFDGRHPSTSQRTFSFFFLSGSAFPVRLQRIDIGILFLLRTNLYRVKGWSRCIVVYGL